MGADNKLGIQTEGDQPAKTGVSELFKDLVGDITKEPAPGEPFSLPPINDELPPFDYDVKKPLDGVASFFDEVLKKIPESNPILEKVAEATFPQAVSYVNAQINTHVDKFGDLLSTYTDLDKNGGIDFGEIMVGEEKKREIESNGFGDTSSHLQQVAGSTLIAGIVAKTIRPEILNHSITPQDLEDAKVFLNQKVKSAAGSDGLLDKDEAVKLANDLAKIVLREDKLSAPQLPSIPKIPGLQLESERVPE